MRTENEIIEKVKQVALDDENVYAVIRTNLKPVSDYTYPSDTEKDMLNLINELRKMKGCK